MVGLFGSPSWTRFELSWPARHRRSEPFFNRFRHLRVRKRMEYGKEARLTSSMRPQAATAFKVKWFCESYGGNE